MQIVSFPRNLCQSASVSDPGNLFVDPGSGWWKTVPSKMQFGMLLIVITLDQSEASIQVMWSLSTNQRAGHLVWGEEHHPRGRDIYTLVSVTALDQSEAGTRGGNQWEASTRPYNDWAVHKNIKPMKSSDSPVSTVIWNDDKTLFTRLLSY